MEIYKVVIRETLEKTVLVTDAHSAEEAKEMVEDKWKNGEYVLTADDFTDVSFSFDSELLCDSES